MSKLQWFRLYSRMIDDDRIRLLAFEDRWHFVALCCLKSDGLLDDPNPDLRMRRIAVKMGLQLRDLEEVKRRLFEVGLIDENMSPKAWDELQYKSDTSSERVKKHREKSKASKVKRSCNVSVTPPEQSRADTDTEQKKDNSTPKSELETVLDSEHSQAVIAHRRSLKKPLTKHAAKLLAKSLSQCPDPNAAADMMIERGWQSIKPEWFERESAPRGQSPPQKPRTSSDAMLDALKDFTNEPNSQNDTFDGHTIEGAPGRTTGKRRDWEDAGTDFHSISNIGGR